LWTLLFRRASFAKLSRHPLVSRPPYPLFARLIPSSLTQHFPVLLSAPPLLLGRLSRPSVCLNCGLWNAPYDFFLPANFFFLISCFFGTLKSTNLAKSFPPPLWNPSLSLFLFLLSGLFPYSPLPPAAFIFPHVATLIEIDFPFPSGVSPSFPPGVLSFPYPLKSWLPHAFDSLKDPSFRRFPCCRLFSPFCRACGFLWSFSDHSSILPPTFFLSVSSLSGRVCCPVVSDCYWFCSNGSISLTSLN